MKDLLREAVNTARPMVYLTNLWTWAEYKGVLFRAKYENGRIYYRFDELDITTDIWNEVTDTDATPLTLEEILSKWRN